MTPFDDIVRQHGEMVWRVCHSLLRPADADDAWAETFLAALVAYPSLPADAHVTGWLSTIAYRKAIDHHRRIRRHAAPTADLADRPAADDPEPVDPALVEAVNQLGVKQRDAVVYHHVVGMSHREVADLLGLSHAAVRRNAADGIANLRRRLTATTRPAAPETPTPEAPTPETPSSDTPTSEMST